MISLNSQMLKQNSEHIDHVLIHELLHSFSKITPESYQTFTGYEEGVVEKLAYRFTEAITGKPDQFKTGYGRYIKVLEGARELLEMGEEEFYTRLLQTPLEDRENVLWQWGLDKFGEEWYKVANKVRWTWLRGSANKKAR